MSRKLKILLASPEVHPYAKTGGLGDISGSLPKALRECGHEVRVIMPKYKSVATSPFGFHPLGKEVAVPVGKYLQTGFLFEGKLHGNIPLILVGNNTYYFREELYGSSRGEYPDNAERFIFFCRSVLETCKALNFQPDIIHCNDWHTGLIPVYLKTLYSGDPFFKDTRTIFSIHNLGYQGNFKPSDMRSAHLPKRLFTPRGVEFYGHFSFMKSALIFSDLLTTVSKTYCREIQTHDFGCGMEGILRNRAQDLYGIINGVDYEEWNPEQDPLLAKTYGAKNLLGKQNCREYLLQRLSLKLNKKSPVLCMITRLSGQKGIDLLINKMQDILEKKIGFVLLGSGESRYEDYFKKLSRRYPKQCASIIKFDGDLAHQIMAGSDMILVPSRYEPCGLTQLYGMKYGTVPIVRAVGGLHDTIKEFDPKTHKGTGFKFKKFKFPYLLQSIERALSCYRNKNRWRQIILNGMAMDYGWERAAKTYIRLYRKALTRKA